MVTRSIVLEAQLDHEAHVSDTALANAKKANASLKRLRLEFDRRRALARERDGDQAAGASADEVLQSWSVLGLGNGAIGQIGSAQNSFENPSGSAEATGAAGRTTMAQTTTLTHARAQQELRALRRVNNWYKTQLRIASGLDATASAAFTGAPNHTRRARRGAASVKQWSTPQSSSRSLRETVAVQYRECRRDVLLHLAKSTFVGERGSAEDKVCSCAILTV